MPGIFNNKSPIPGITGNRVPGSARLPAMGGGGFQTNVPFQNHSGDQWGSAIFREYHRQQVRDTRGRFAGGWGIAWQGLEAIDAALVDWDRTNHENLKRAVEKIKDEMVAYMKANATWTDRTTDARTGLQGVVIWEDINHFTIMLGHGNNVYYGIWLEVRWGGRYAVVAPTVQHFAPQFAAKIRTMT